MLDLSWSFPSFLTPVALLPSQLISLPLNLRNRWFAELVELSHDSSLWVLEFWLASHFKFSSQGFQLRPTLNWAWSWPVLQPHFHLSKLTAWLVSSHARRETLLGRQLTQSTAWSSFLLWNQSYSIIQLAVLVTDSLKYRWRGRPSRVYRRTVRS